MLIWIVTLILAATLVLLVTEKIPVDLTGLMLIAVLAVTGILTPLEAVAGFANPAVITVGAMFLISRGMIRTGSVGFIAQKVVQYSRGKASLALLVVLLIVAVASAFINNTPVVVLFIPIILSLSCEYGLSPSKFLIPVSYASILAGTCTLIGTSTNIIVSDLSALYGYGHLGMFELARVGLPVALMGIAFLYFIAPRIMPGHVAPACEMADGADRRYLAEMKVPPESPLVDQEPVAFLAARYPSFELIEVIRKAHVFHPDPRQMPVEAGDILFVKGSANDLVAALNDRCADLPYAEDKLAFGEGRREELIVELIIPPQSDLIRERLMETGLNGDPAIHIIAIKSRGMYYAEQKIRDVRLRVGDILLVRCPREKLEGLRSGGDFMIIEDIHHEIIHKRKARIALAIFGAVVVAAATGLAEIMVCALAGMVLMLLTGCLQLRDAYRALQGDVLLLIAGTIALGTALEKTGASGVYARVFLDLFQGAGPQVILAGFLLMTSIGTQVLSNNATAVLLIPVAISTAIGMGVSPKPFIMAVCFGASACFASPIGYQTNLLVYGPGGYRFADYFKLGIPLNFMVIGMGTWLIPLFWPF